MTMKSFLPFLLSITLSIGLFAQNVDKGLLDTSKKDTIEVKESPNQSDRVSSTVFFKQYNITPTNKKRAKIITLTTLQKDPIQNSSTLSSLSAGETVYLLKLFPKDKVWAVQYNDTFGFVSVTDLMQVREEVKSSELAFDTPPQLKNQVSIDYPQAALDANIEGRVILKIFINSKGKVTKSEVIKGIKELNKAAQEMVLKLRFKPARLNKKKVDTWLTFPVRFSLEKYYKARRTTGY